MIEIVIVNWNSGGYLFKCIQSILTPNNEPRVSKIYVIDNNSSDNSISLLPKDSKINIIHNNHNLGFSKACNQGFMLCKAPYTLLLNPDAQLSDTTLKDCVSFMENYNNADILGVSLFDDKGKLTYSCARFPSPLHYFYDTTGLSKIAPKIFTPALLMADWDHKSSRYVDQVIGAFMFMRTSIFQKIGYFDERFFVYCEELDFSKRLAQHGGKSYYKSDITAVHSGQGTTHSVKAFRLSLSLISRLQYCKKHFKYSGYLFVLFCTYFIEPFTRIIFLCLKGNFAEIKEITKGYKLSIKKQKRYKQDFY